MITEPLQSDLMEDETELDEESDDVEIQYLSCDSCGYTGEDVYSDGFGYNICTGGSCNQYTARGISPHDFY